MLLRFKFFYAFSLLTAVLRAETDTLVARTFSDAWIEVDDVGRVAQSFGGISGNVGGFFLLTADLEQGALRFCGNDYAIWLEGRLVGSFDSCHFLQSEDFGFSTSDTLFIVVLGQELEEMSVELLAFEPEGNSVFGRLSERLGSGYYSVWTIATILLIAGLVFLRRSNTRRYYDLINLRFLRWSTALEGSDVLSFNLLLATITGFLIAFGRSYFKGDNPVNTEAVLGHMLGIYFILFLKFVIVVLVSRLFKFQKISTLQFSSFLQFSILILILTYGFEWVFVWHLGGLVMGSTAFTYLMVIMANIFLIYVYGQLASKFSARKLHLISYLCATEILPTFILAIWLID